MSYKSNVYNIQTGMQLIFSNLNFKQVGNRFLVTDYWMRHQLLFTNKTEITRHKLNSLWQLAVGTFEEVKF